MKQAISAGHEQTLNVAKEILLDGGNAFDAVTAAYFTMFISEPAMASAGGNGYALSRLNSGKIECFDFFIQTPKFKQLDRDKVDFHPILVDFGDETEEFHIGMAAAAVPGTIAGILAIHERYGSIPIKTLIEPAKELAKSGLTINAFQAHYLYLLASIISQDERGKSIYFDKQKIKTEGDKIHMSGVADFLDFIADEGKRGFYHGEIARKITDDSKERGGFLRMEDFEDYKVLISEPLHFNYRDKTIHVPNGPNKGGVSMALFLAHLDSTEPQIAQSIRKTKEIMRSKKDIPQLMDQFYPFNNYQNNQKAQISRGTSHLNVLDKKGNAISLTTSIGEGCGYFIPGTDMQLNNMLGELFLLPDGKHSWSPGVRMGSMMTPSIVTRDNGSLSLLAGSGGAERIPFAIGQVIHHYFKHAPNLLSAIEQPRYHFQNDQYQLEAGANWNESDKNIVRWNSKSLYFGGVHAIAIDKDNISAEGDSRRYGVAEVF